MTTDEPLPEGSFTVTIRFVPDEHGYFIELLGHEGVFSQGATKYHALAMLADAWWLMDGNPDNGPDAKEVAETEQIIADLTPDDPRYQP